MHVETFGYQEVQHGYILFFGKEKSVILCFFVFKAYQLS